MALAGSIKLPCDLGVHNFHGRSNQRKNMIGRGQVHLFGTAFSLRVSDSWSFHVLNGVQGPKNPICFRHKFFLCRSLLIPGGGNESSILKSVAIVLTRSYNSLCGSPLAYQLVPAVGIIAFAAWGLGPLMRLSRNLFLHKSDSSWKKSSTHYIMTSYVQPLILWAGVSLICRALDPVTLPSEASHAVKQRLLNFVQSLSTVLAFAFCLSSLIQQAQKFFMEANDHSDARNMGFQFAGKAVYSAVWVAAVSLFMELLGFSTQRWLTAGGLGTVLLTLAGREIFTNFLSSVMIHATQPFVLNEWIQTKIEGYEVSGTVEHVGWWSPTIIRGDDREAVHIPNHKFTVNVVRNLSQKTHWRIKTHFAISHLDVSKINNIVADMRKVLAKNPQVEQQRLHRRVFLDDVNPENQALMILVSCFVKSSHIEEYLRVKEIILLDLLRVISHHQARLATPIRTVQKIHSEAELENIPFANSVFTRSRAPASREFVLIEPSYKINNDDYKTRAPTHSFRLNEEKDAKIGAATTSDSKIDATDSKTNDRVMATSTSNSGSNPRVSAMPKSDSKTPNLISEALDQNNFEKQQPKGASIGDSLEEVAGLSSEGGVIHGKTSPTYPESGAKKTDISSSSSTATQDDERSLVSSSVSRPALEENIVLGVALDGSKRTLPIGDELIPSPTHGESKELTACRNGSGAPTVGKDKKDGQISAVPGASPSDLRDK